MQGYYCLFYIMFYTEIAVTCKIFTNTSVVQVALEHTTIKWVFELDPEKISKKLTAYTFILGPSTGVIGAIVGARTGGKIRTAALGL